MPKLKLSVCLIVLCTLVLFSCHKPVDYEFTIMNYTNYRIDKMIIGYDSPDISIEPNGITTTVGQANPDTGLGDPFVRVSIYSYSDSLGIYLYAGSDSVSPDKLNEKSHNFVQIRLNPESQHPNTVFLITVNE